MKLSKWGPKKIKKASNETQYHRQLQIVKARRKAIVSRLMNQGFNEVQIVEQMMKHHRMYGSTPDNPYINIARMKPWSKDTIKKDMDAIWLEIGDEIQKSPRYTMWAQLHKLDEVVRMAYDIANDLTFHERLTKATEAIKEQNKLLGFHRKVDGISKDEVERKWQLAIENISKLLPQNSDNDETKKMMILALEAAFTGRSPLALLKEIANTEDARFVDVKSGNNGETD